MHSEGKSKKKKTSINSTGFASRISFFSPGQDKNSEFRKVRCGIIHLMPVVNQLSNGRKTLFRKKNMSLKVYKSLGLARTG